MLKVLPSQRASLEGAQYDRFSRAVWQAYGETAGKRLPPIDEREALALIDAAAHVCVALDFHEPTLIARTAIYALMSKAIGLEGGFTAGLVVFVAARYLPEDEAFRWVERTLAEADHGR